MNYDLTVEDDRTASQGHTQPNSPTWLVGLGAKVSRSSEPVPASYVTGEVSGILGRGCRAKMGRERKS